MVEERNIPFDMPEITIPSFPDRIYDVRDHGAVGDGNTLNTLAFNKTIGACHQEGGGLVLIPAGQWLTGPIHLRSNVHLHLERDALVKFSRRFEDYLPIVFTRWEGIECYNYSPLIYARECKNIAVTGEGAFDGQGEAWWNWKKLQQPAARTLYDAEFNRVPVEKRVFGTQEAALRPQFLQTINCNQVLIEGVSFINGPMWTIHPVYCENVVIRNIRVNTFGPNTDGLNPDSCRYVFIEGCSFATGDDCIAINSGMNEDGWRVARPCEYIIIRNCVMSEGHGAVAIGSGMSGGVRNVYVHDCRVTGGDQGIRLKSMRGRGGYVENIFFENFHMAGLRHEAIILNMFYSSSTAESKSGTPPVFRNIHIKSITCDSAGTAIAIRGLPEQPIERVVLEGLRINAIMGIFCQDAIDLTLSNVSGIIQSEPLLSCSNITGLNITNMSVKKSKLEV